MLENLNGFVMESLLYQKGDGVGCINYNLASKERVVLLGIGLVKKKLKNKITFTKT